MTATLDHTMTSPVAFDPPGPGAWTLDFDHQASARGLLMQELFTRNFVSGTQSCFSRYGMPLDRLEGRHVNGWFYSRPVPAGVPDNGASRRRRRSSRSRLVCCPSCGGDAASPRRPSPPVGGSSTLAAGLRSDATGSLAVMPCLQSSSTFSMMPPSRITFRRH